MAQFPIAEAEIAELAMRMVAGLMAYSTDFPSTDPAAIDTAKQAYENAKAAQTSAIAASKIATTAKNNALRALEKVMKLQLARSQIDVTDEPLKLELIGWGPRRDAVSIQPPSPPSDLTAAVQDGAVLILKWNKSAANGSRVREYVIERREEPAGGGAFGEWSLAAMAFERQVKLPSQPRGIQMEYRIRARNLGGQSPPSNTVAVVL